MTVQRQESFGKRLDGFVGRFRKNPIDALGKFARNRIGLKPKSLLLEKEAKPTSDRPGAKPTKTASTSTLKQAIHKIVQMEAQNRSAPYAYGLSITEHLRNATGVRALLDALEDVTADVSISAFLIYLRCVCLAKMGRLDEASDLASDALMNSRKTSAMATLTPEAVKRRSRILCKTWHVIDAIRHENYRWQNDGKIESLSYADISSFVKSKDIYDLTFEEDQPDLFLFIAEPPFQHGEEDRYLKVGREAFQRAERIEAKIEIIKAIIHSGVGGDRRAAHALGRDYYAMVKPEWMSVIEYVSLDLDHAFQVKSPVRLSRLLQNVLRLAQDLNFAEDMESILNALNVLVQTFPKNQAIIWIAASAFMIVDPVAHAGQAELLIESTTRAPKTVVELCDYLEWGLQAQAYSEVISTVEKMSPEIFRSEAGFLYAKILQRAGRFREAALFSKQGQASMLAKSYAICPFKAWAGLAMCDELAFAAETADVYSLVPQPEAPKGVLFVTTRLASQMRSLPIIMLMELKRAGWAVIPLVEGILPLEETGVAKLNQFLGCMTPTGQTSNRAAACLQEEGDADAVPGDETEFEGHRDFECVQVDSEDAQIVFEDLEHLTELAGFEEGEPVLYDAEQMKLVWRGLDFSQALQAEDVMGLGRGDLGDKSHLDPTRLDQSVEAARTSAKVLHNLHLITAELELRAACLAGDNRRLSDAMFRGYCEAFGDPDAFFCVQAVIGHDGQLGMADGPSETRCLLENVTRYPQTNSVGFPRFEVFENHYTDKNRSDEFVEHQALEFANAAVHESADTALGGGNTKILEARIQHWKTKGGHVACLFAQSAHNTNMFLNEAAVHRDIKDWLNHTIEAVSGRETLLLIQPNDYEVGDNVPSNLGERFADLVETGLPENVIFLNRGAFNMSDLVEFVDVGLVYHDIAALKLGILRVPCILSAKAAAADFPIGHIAPLSRDEYAEYVRFERPVQAAPDLQARSVSWLDFVRSDDFAPAYRYHARQKDYENFTPSGWVQEDIRRYLMSGDQAISNRLRDVILDR